MSSWCEVTKTPKIFLNAQPGLGGTTNGRLHNHVLVLLDMSSQCLQPSQVIYMKFNYIIDTKLKLQNNTRYGQKHSLNNLKVIINDT